MNPKVDFYFARENQWTEAIAQLRRIILECGLTEELKWGTPCYTFEGRNVLLVHTFKEYCAILFFKGTLLEDADGMLVQQTERVQAMRQLRFTSVREVTSREASIKAYIYQAIEVERAGLKVPKKKTEEYSVPEEFARRLKADKALKKAFAALTPGRQRAYLLYFAGAKQSKTREARVAKYVPQILAGKGLDD
ncbi:YdeI/OmpD-associated family protein [Flaviaesturariibacter terrae]